MMTEKEEKKEVVKEKKVEKEVGEKKASNKKSPVLMILAAVVIVAAMLGGVVIKKAKDFVGGETFSRLTKGFVDGVEKGDEITITAEEGKFTFEEEGSLPDSFPSDFPVYPDAKLASSWVADGDRTDGLSLIWETEDSVSTVSNYFERELKKSDWVISFTSETEDSTTFAFEKNESRGFIGITVEDSKVVISLTLGV